MATIPASREAPFADLRRLAVDLAARRQLMYASLLSELAERVDPPLRDSPALWAKLATCLREALDEELAAFGAIALPEGCPPAARSCLELLAAGRGTEPTAEFPRLLHMALWDAWLELVESHAAPATRGGLLRRGSDFLFAYAELLSGHTVAAHRGEPPRPPDAARRRLAAVEGVLDGDLGAAAALDYDLERHHLALIAWGGKEPAALARELAMRLERPLLCVATPGTLPVCWAWISGIHPLGAAEERSLREFWPSQVGRLALGCQAFGPEGFRAGHRQAERARRFAVCGPQLVRYEDIVVESLAAENEEDARAFVAHELRGIEDDSSASQRLRETLEAYFAAEYNAASAAAHLGVHQQTVANRLRAVEERLGQASVGARRVELEVALRLRACFDHPSVGEG